MDFEDKNLKAVVQKAAKMLKIPVSSLKYEVISYGSTGIFGLVGAKKAKIRVINSTPEKDRPKEKVQKKEAPRSQDEGDRLREEKPAVEKTPPQEQIVSTENAIEKGRMVTQKIVEKITEDAVVHVEIKNEEVVFRVEGGKTALIIGKRGQTLEAIQYLVDRIVNKNSEKRIRIQIDVAGYLENRKANLEQRALHMAEKVKKTGKPVTVGELNVYDRKIVHLCLKEDRDIRTQSMGSGFYRKLVIFPKKASATKKNKP